MFCAENVTRAVALTRCAEEGMRLAWLETPSESEALRENIVAADVNFPGGNPELLTQIGASDAQDEGEWTWVGSAALGNGVAPNGFQFWDGGAANDGGEVVDDAYVDWVPIEPNNSNNEDCGAMLVLGNGTREGQWDDRLCNLQIPYVCETP
jgi:hypothetical protein